MNKSNRTTSPMHNGQGGNMYLFTGNWEYSVDEKGRLAVPAPLRRDLEGSQITSYMITRGFEGTLWLFPLPVWSQFIKGLSQLNIAQSEARFLYRMFFSAATECIPDKQGRISIPAALRNEIGLTDSAFICGMGQLIEIWGKVAWDNYRFGQTKTLEEVGAEFLNMSIFNFAPLSATQSGGDDGP